MAMSRDRAADLALHSATRDAKLCNVPTNVWERTTSELHNQPHHPIHTIKRRIQRYFESSRPTCKFFDKLSPVVSTEQNFDVLGFPADHVGRSRSDTYYLTESKVLRTHTSAHQVQLLRAGEREFLVCGDVYRRDEIDASHYPVFHQLEGVAVASRAALAAAGVADVDAHMERELKATLEGTMRAVFPRPMSMRWLPDAFPFTHPSWQMEVQWGDRWLEILGCGVIAPHVLANGLGAKAAADQVGWAFGLGLDRLAMLLFEIPDVRMLWSRDPRFTSQFTSDAIVKFAPYSRYPACTKDVSFWLPAAAAAAAAASTAAVATAADAATIKPFHPNEVFDIARSVAGDLVESVRLVDSFERKGRTSHCYRIAYQAHDQTLTNAEVDALQASLRSRLQAELGVELR